MNYPVLKETNPCCLLLAAVFLHVPMCKKAVGSWGPSCAFKWTSISSASHNHKIHVKLHLDVDNWTVVAELPESYHDFFKDTFKLFVIECPGTHVKILIHN